MTNKEAISIITQIKGIITNDNSWSDKAKVAVKEAFDLAIKALEERPQVEREFIEILAQNVPDDICTYPEYKGKPYYSIHYKENGEEFVGYGTYKIEVLSRYLKEYFMKGGAE